MQKQSATPLLKSRLLIVSCSKRKKTTHPDTLVKACDLYDGVFYRTIKKWLEQYRDDRLEILIISTKYGLIKWDEYIYPYDLRMNKSVATSLIPKISDGLYAYSSATISDIYVELGRDYLDCIPDLSHYFKGTSISYSSGKIGYRLHNIISWLNSGIQ